MESRAAATQALIPQLTGTSNITPVLLQCTADVISQTRETFVHAQNVQLALMASEGASAKLTFYRRNYSRAKGIINEVREVADSVTGLAESSEMAVAGSNDVEQVRCGRGRGGRGGTWGDVRGAQR